MRSRKLGTAGAESLRINIVPGTRRGNRRIEHDRLSYLRTAIDTSNDKPFAESY